MLTLSCGADFEFRVAPTERVQPGRLDRVRDDLGAVGAVRCGQNTRKSR